MTIRRTSASWAAAIIGLCLAFWLVGHFAAASPASFDWDAATGAATAYGTLALALVTWRLVLLTRADASGTLELARLAEREQESREQTLRRERIERILDAVNQLVDATIIEKTNPDSVGVPIAKSRLRSAIAVSGIAVKDGQLGSTELLTRTPVESIEGQGDSARIELAAMLAEIDQATAREPDRR